MIVTFHFDVACPWTWMTSRWLTRAAREDGLELTWAPLSLAWINRDRDIPEQFRAGVAASAVAARLVQHLSSAGDHDAVAAFYAAWGQRFHVEGASPSVDLVVDAAIAAGLDADKVRATVADESLDAAVGEATDAAVAAAGPEIGSPVITWTEEDSREVAVFGPIISDLPEPAHAAELWRSVRTLAAFPGFNELKRGTRADLNTRATAI